MTREQIIAEIKRTAALNGGVPVGVRRFLSETGISQNVWAGKFWLRWSDALREAGFSPNDFETGYTDDDLLELLAGYTRELGHIPSGRELKMKGHSDSDFPSEKTFRRFGGKAPLARRLSEYSAPRAYDDVIAICAPLIREPEAESARADPTVESEAESDGYVYMIKLGKHYKIGKTFAVPRRHREIALELPEKPDIVHSIRTDDPTGIEAYWHARFAAKRTNGEWFALSSEDVRAFKKRKSFM